MGTVPLCECKFFVHNLKDTLLHPCNNKVCLEGYLDFQEIINHTKIRKE